MSGSFCMRDGMRAGQPYVYGQPADGRPQSARVCIVPKSFADTFAPYTPAPWIAPIQGLHRGHMVGRSLGGGSRAPGSITWQTAKANLSRMTLAENPVRAFMKAGIRVWYQVRVEGSSQYEDVDFVAKGLHIVWFSEAGSPFTTSGFITR